MIKRREFCLGIGAALLLPGRFGTSQTEVFAAKVFRNTNGETMPYRLFVPRNYDKRQRYPLLLWLHGGEGRGDDNLRQISGGNTIGSHVWTQPPNQSNHRCFVVAPQCPANESWATVDTAPPTKQIALVLELLRELRNTFNLDLLRFYVVGQSLGGFGTWSIISQNPQMFAAAIPVCGGGNESEASKLINMPIWAFHGEKDQAVPVERSRRMIGAIRQAGGSPRYTEFSGAGHVIWDRVFHEPTLLSWVFSQSKV